MPTRTRRVPDLDDARDALLEILGAAVYAEGVSTAGYQLDDVYDAGRARHERLISFDLATPDGAARDTFTITITRDEG